jgi:hypothetical protein
LQAVALLQLVLQDRHRELAIHTQAVVVVVQAVVANLVQIIRMAALAAWDAKAGSQVKAVGMLGEVEVAYMQDIL